MRRWTVACCVVGLGFSAFIRLAGAGQPSAQSDVTGQADDPVQRAEQLWRLAEQKALSDDLAAEAAELLDADDPFARGLAEWALATRVELDNKGQDVRWPQADPPAWRQRWLQLSPEAMIEADYVRFAVLWEIHRDGQKLLDSAHAIVLRAHGAADEALRSGSDTTRTMVERQLDQLDAICRQLAEQVERSPDDLPAHRRLWLCARQAARPIVMANPAADVRRLLFVKQYAAHTHRNITGSQYPWVHKPGGGIYVQEGLEPGSPIREVLQGQLGPGHVRGIDLWWDGTRMVFGYARQAQWPPPFDTVSGNYAFELRGHEEPIHLFEIGVDGSGLRQLTDHPFWSDLEPTYCADGSIVFASDRSGRSSECGRFSADHTVVNLYAVDADGSRVRRVNDNKDIDRHPHSLDNGLIAYTRWEYQERHFMQLHSIWAVRPNGAMADALFKQHLGAPFGLRDTRSVPNSPLLVSIATGHHTFAYGPLVLVDPRHGINTDEGLRIVTPHSKPEEGRMAGEPVDSGGVADRGGLYHGPWALSETCFLVSFSHARPPSNTSGGTNASGFAVYLVDVHGNKELVHRDLLLSCAFPMPLGPRRRPPILPASPVLADRQDAVCYVADVYRDMPGIPRGTIKYLRIAQRVGWPLDEKIGAMRYIPDNAWTRQFGYWSWAPVRVLGKVPVAEDGSAHFTVPADEAVYFQALDENQMEVRRMRSHVTFQPGELRGCVGCHQTQSQAPPIPRHLGLAFRRAPDTPEPPPWGAGRLLGYEWLVQPIFDRHCTTCHGHADPEGGIDLSATRADDGFVQSFRTLFGRREGTDKQFPPLVSVSNRFDDVQVTAPKQFGSHASRLIAVLRNDPLHCKEVKLSPDQWRALVTWIDANAPYYDSFYNKRPKEGGPPRRDVYVQY